MVDSNSSLTLLPSGPQPSLPQQQPADEKSHPDQSRAFVAEKVRPQLEDVVRQQPRQRDSEGNERQRDENVADQPRMPAHIEIIHPAMPPAGPEFFK